MKRGKDDVIGAILDLCQEPSSKTRIVYQINLNFKTVKPYLDILVVSGCLETPESS